jgi:hypothetical protein
MHGRLLAGILVSFQVSDSSRLPAMQSIFIPIIPKIKVSLYSCHLSGIGGCHREFRSHLKKVFWPNFFDGRSIQILEIHGVCLRFESRIRLKLEPKSVF